MALGKIVKCYKGVKKAINRYIEENVEQKKVIPSTMDISSVDESGKNDVSFAIPDNKNDLNINYVLSNSSFLNSIAISSNSDGVLGVNSTSEPYVYDLLQNDKYQGLQIFPDRLKNDKFSFDTVAVVELNSKNVAFEVVSNKLIGPAPNFIYSDASIENQRIVKSSIEFSSTLNTLSHFYPLNKNDSGQHQEAQPATPSVSVTGPFSMLPDNDKELISGDRRFLNSILSLSIYTGNDEWTSHINKKLLEGQVYAPNDILLDNSLYTDGNKFNGLDRVVAAYYATTFMPAQILPNGKFEGHMGEKKELRDFEFNDGVYRSNDNMCAASSMVSKNEDGTYTLHMTYRGTDNESRKNGKFSDIENKFKSVKAFNGIMRFARYVVTAYTDMGRHHENFEPFEKACLEFASNPDNKISKIEVSGHSLGGAMVQRFLKSDALLNSEFSDKTQGMTWGAPQTNANLVGKSLVFMKRVIGVGVEGIKDTAMKSYIEYLNSYKANIIDKERSNAINAVEKTLSVPLVFSNLIIKSVVKFIPNVGKFTKNVTGAFCNLIKKTSYAADETYKEYENSAQDIIDERRLGRKHLRVIKGVSDKKFRNMVLDAIHYTPDVAISLLQAVPKVTKPLTKRIKDIWQDLENIDLPESKLRQFFHKRDPVPATTNLLSTDVGKKVNLTNYVDNLPVWQQAINGPSKKTDDMIKNPEKYEAKHKEYNLVTGAIKGIGIFTSNVVETLTVGNHNMKKYMINTMMEDSFLRRTNINSNNSRFKQSTATDKAWLDNTKNITKFEMLLQTTFLEDVIYNQAKLGEKDREHRGLTTRPVGKLHEFDFEHKAPTKKPTDIRIEVNKTINICKNLYGDKNPSLTDDFGNPPDFSTFYNMSAKNLDIRPQRNKYEKINDIAEETLAETRKGYLVNNLKTISKQLNSKGKIEENLFDKFRASVRMAADSFESKEIGEFIKDILHKEGIDNEKILPIKVDAIVIAKIKHLEIGREKKLMESLDEISKEFKEGRNPLLSASVLNKFKDCAEKYSMSFKNNEIEKTIEKVLSQGCVSKDKIEKFKSIGQEVKSSENIQDIIDSSNLVLNGELIEKKKSKMRVLKLSSLSR